MFWLLVLLAGALAGLFIVCAVLLVRLVRQLRALAGELAAALAHAELCTRLALEVASVARDAAVTARRAVDLAVARASTHPRPFTYRQW